MNAPLEIHFYCNSVPFTEATINLETSLGGSESALIFLARGLVERGHRVAIYTRMAERDGKPWAQHYIDAWGLRWIDHSIMQGMIQARQPEVFVSCRMPQIMGWAGLQDCKLRILWNEDLLMSAADYYANSWQVDVHAFVSEYHREQYLREIPSIREQAWATTNPVDIEAIHTATARVAKDPNRLIHVSRPERALIAGNRSPLLEIFARLRERNPALTLGVCRYHSMYEGSPNVDAICRQADQLVAATDGVEWLGELDKRGLYREISKSQLMVYPGVAGFAETMCIAAVEAQACGTPLVCSDRGGLKETLHPGGRRIKGDPLDEGYQEAFVAACQNLLEAPDTYAAEQSAGCEWTKRFDFRRVAEEWETYCLDWFAERYRRNRVAVFDRCMWHDDIRAAYTVAEDIEHDRATIPYEPFRILQEWTRTNEDSPEAYAEHAMKPEQEYIGENRRLAFTRDMLRPLYPTDEARAGVRQILDFAGGNGTYSALLLDQFPQAHVTLIDYSPELCDTARAWIDRCDEGAHKERFTTICGSLDAIPRTDYDLVFCGEFAEHCIEPEKLLSDLERHASSNGQIVITVPQGPFGSMMHRNSLDWSEHRRGHRFAFEARDLEAMFGEKPGYSQAHMPIDPTPRSELVGHYIAYWQPDGQPVSSPDIARKVSRARPRQRLAVCMIVRNAEADVMRCLKSVDAIADEVWIADTGSTDATMALAEPFTRNGGAVWSIGCCPDVPNLPTPGHFGWARNQSISRVTADWILWIDADEVLENAAMLPLHLVDNGFNGYILHQCHLTMDTLSPDMVESGKPYRFDRPIRVFRRRPRGAQAEMTYQCFGAIHEHFQASLNDLIEPAISINDCQLAHFGYLNEPLRRGKAQMRNLPLLQYDRQLYPDRILGWLLLARDYCNVAKWRREELMLQTGDANIGPGDARPLLLKAALLIHEHFWGKAPMYWEAAFPVYEEALLLGGYGVEYGVFEVDVEGNMKPRRYRFLTLEHFEEFQDMQRKKLRDHLRMPAVEWDEVGMEAVDGSADRDVKSDPDRPAAGE